MIVTTQEATYAELTHDTITYKAHAIGSVSNAIQIVIAGSGDAIGLTMSLANNVITIAYETSGILSIADYTANDIKHAHNVATQEVRDLIHIYPANNNHVLTQDLSANLVGGLDKIEVLARGVYAGMTEIELLDLRSKIRKAFVDNTTGTQVISVSMGGKQVTKKLPEFAELKYEMIGISVALAQLNPVKYGKVRKRFAMDFRSRRT